MVTALSLVAATVAALFFGVIPVILVVAAHYIVDLIGWGGVVVPILLFLSLLLTALVAYRESIRAGVIDFLAFCVVFVGWIVSKMVVAIRRLGSIFSLFLWITNVLGRYPGKKFIENRREEFVQRGIEYYENGDVEIQSAPEDLARQTREHYANAGRSLSNGEAVLGIALAVLALIPPSSEIIDVVPLLQSPIIISGLSAGVVFVVTLRLAALDLVLVRDVSASVHPARLEVYKAWNQTMSSGTELVKTLFMIRAMHTISQAAYEFYLDWVFDRSFNGDGAGVIEVIDELRRPLFAFIFAEWDNVTPVEASEDRYGKNVFAQFDFWPAENDLPSEGM